MCHSNSSLFTLREVLLRILHIVSSVALCLIRLCLLDKLGRHTSPYLVRAYLCV